MVMRRLLTHLNLGRWHLRNIFNAAARGRVRAAVEAAEKGHTGEIRIVIEGNLPLHRVWRGVSPRKRAEEIFTLERVWDTQDNNGVLLYVLYADRSCEIVADRGLNQKIERGAWEMICRNVHGRVRDVGLVEGICEAVGGIGELLRKHCPTADLTGNELADEVVIR